eukprot:CAMPEP_0115430122 /NCGR_PEP_ID=MMETSP0271-20121206/30882_1 /TAXON_ID=71861 /ORGANISM="Scrippsiella trochoidea, Strain CCMP3099" /LENGTH=136 /DNA_ID=CAMNT_0002855341 /DNA_START=1280 /DNA_END=1692 /DNA_ORIENTATION=+
MTRVALEGADGAAALMPSAVFMQMLATRPAPLLHDSSATAELVTCIGSTADPDDPMAPASLTLDLEGAGDTDAPMPSAEFMQMLAMRSEALVHDSCTTAKLVNCNGSDADPDALGFVVNPQLDPLASKRQALIYTV